MTIESNQGSSSFALTDDDRSNLSRTDDQFHPHTWDELKQIIAEHDLGILKRWPSDLKRYIQWSTDTKAKYGNVQNYIMEDRLNWQPIPNSNPEEGPQFVTHSTTPFRNTNDYRIMPNDWPYGFAPGIRHLIVWSKIRLESEPTRGDMTPKSNEQVRDFVQNKFINRVKGLPGPEEKVMWFKNWTSLQSVPGMEHVHILVRDVPQDIIDEWTGGEQIQQS